MNLTRRLSFLAFLAIAVLGAARAQDSAYCNITSVQARQLSNGVQITVRADGVLRYQRYWGSDGAKVTIRFTNAKSTVAKSFIDVGKYPVSYIQLSVPQDAKQGVGILLQATLYDAAQVNIESSADQQTAIITVNSQHTVQRRAGGGGPEAVVPAEAAEVAFADGKLSVHAVKAKLTALLARIGKETQTNVAVDDSVKDREVSMALDGLSVDDTLHGIAGASGLALSLIDGVYMVSDGVPTDLATYHLSSTESFRMKYTRAQAASGLLPTFLYSYLHVNEAQNAVVVTAPNQMLDKIRADFQKIDLTPPQIMIEALAVEVATTDDMNADLGLASVKPSWMGSSDPVTGNISYSTIGTLPREFQANLNALVAQGKAQVRANPRMAAVNGQDADLFIGQTRFIKVEYVSSGYKQEQIQGVDIGVKLGMRSWTGGNGEITVTLQPEVSNISEIERESGLPVLSTRRAQTTVRVKDGETIMIGGLTQKQEYRTHTKTPLLGDLPLVGLAFRSTKTNKVNSELVIFVTPHILTDKGRLPDDAKEQALRKRFQ
ncbi:MAG TPA: hypothetical protein VGM37_06150 [Armatimonadota bacterium]|jgi:hypothetical protein